MEKTKLNKLPAPTFRFVGVNFTERDVTKPEPDAAREISPVDGVPVQLDVKDNGSRAFKVTAHGNEKNEVILYTTAAQSFTDIDIDLDAYSSLKLIQVFEGAESAVSHVNARLDENAHFENVQFIINSSDVVSEVNALLSGRGARFDHDSGFVLKQNEKADINLNAVHTGKKTVSEINAKGVLSDRADKVFKGTIDFKKGAKGAVGKETEDILLLSENARNRTVPLILCAEEDVEGSHGASIGRVDEKSVFYMLSRGIPEEKIYELAARAKTQQVISKITDPDTLKRVRRAVSGGEEDE